MQISLEKGNIFERVIFLLSSSIKDSGERLSFRYITFIILFCYPFDPDYTGRQADNQEGQQRILLILFFSVNSEQQKESLILAEDLLIRRKLN